MRTRRQNFILILTLGFLNALTPFTIDLYLPAFPEIAAALNTPVARMSLTVSLYFIGYAFGQIFYGPLLDRFGRKPPMFAGLGIYIAASLGCMTAQSFEAMLVFRLLSALGGCAASVGVMSMVRDLFPAKEGGKVFSMLMLVLSASPLLAPTIGSFMAGAWGWRVLFAVLAGMAVVDLLLLAFVLPNAYEADRSVALKPGSVGRVFLEVFREPSFRAYTLSGSLSFAGLFVFVSGSPALFMGEYAVSAREFGMVFALLAGGMIGGGQLNHLLLRRWGGGQVFRGALICQVVVGCVFLIAAWGAAPRISVTLVLLFSYLLCAGISYPNAASLALEPFSKNIGSASSLLGFLQLSLGSVAAALVGMSNAGGAIAMASVMASCSMAGAAIFFGLTRRKRPA